MKRKNRLKKGIEAMQEQVDFHKQKKKQADAAGMPELVEYYKREIEAKEEAMKQKKKLLDKQ